MTLLLHAVLMLLIPRAESPPPAEVKSSFLKLLDRPRVPLDAKVESSATDRGFVVEQVSFASEKKADGSIERVPTLVVRPTDDAKRRPAVIVLHGTGGTKEGMRPWLNELAGRGFVGVAIDARYHGGRSGGSKGAEAYNRAIVEAWRAKSGDPQEHPFYYDTCWDIWRAVDYLQSRDRRRPGADRSGRDQHGRHRDLARRGGRRPDQGRDPGDLGPELPLEPEQRPVARPAPRRSPPHTRPPLATWASQA